MSLSRSRGSRVRNYSKRKHTLTKRELGLLERYKVNGRLSEDQSYVLESFYIGGELERDIARDMGISQPSVSILLRQGRMVLHTGRPSSYYRRVDSLGRELSWDTCKRRGLELSRGLMRILRMRYDEGRTMLSIGEEMGLSQPQVSMILSACSKLMVGD